MTKVWPSEDQGHPRMSDGNPHQSNQVENIPRGDLSTQRTTKKGKTWCCQCILAWTDESGHNLVFWTLTSEKHKPQTFSLIENGIQFQNVLLDCYGWLSRLFSDQYRRKLNSSPLSVVRHVPGVALLWIRIRDFPPIYIELLYSLVASLCTCEEFSGRMGCTWGIVGYTVGVS